MAKKRGAIGNKISTIMHEGVRRNTHKPVSKSNKRRPVSNKQAVAIALSMARHGKLGKKSKNKAKNYSQKRFDRARKKHFGLK